MNAHTAGDVLANVPGLQQDLLGGPGSANAIYIRGGRFNHVRILIDGVTISDLVSNYPDVDAIPARIIERIEVMKGPASSSWGSALAGVINIITKAPADAPIAGSGYASVGSGAFRDVSGSVTGSIGNLGYYLYGGHLGYDRLGPNNAAGVGNAFSKLQWILPKGDVTASFIYFPSSFRIGEGLVDKADTPQMTGYLRGRYSIANGLDVEVTGHTSTHPFTITERLPEEWGGGSATRKGSDLSAGGDFVLRWTTDFHRLSFGYDFENGSTKWTRYMNNDVAPYERHHVIKNGIFLTDTLTLGPVSITPSIRYDWTNQFLNRDDFSANLGTAWRITEGTIFRASIGKGYGFPEVSQDQIAQKIWAAQAGVETTDIPYLWGRTTVFYNEIRNAPDLTTGELLDQRKTGVEVELKTVPVFSTSVSGGFMFQNVTDMKTGDVVKGEPRYSWNVGVHYSDSRGLRGTLLGRYVWWNDAPDYQAKYNGFIWDFTGTKKFIVDGTLAPEIFFTVHNIFNASQYQISFFKNPGRWAEGGIRFSF